MALILLLSMLIGLPRRIGQYIAPEKSLVRACPENWDEPRPNKKTGAAKKKHARIKKAGACVEIAAPPLDIQEFLQVHARKENWAITADQLTQESWAFSLDLSKDELIRDTSAETNPKGVEWTGGNLSAHINSTQLPDGYARTTVHAIIRGYGRNQDQFAMQKEYWELESSNAFEASIALALSTHFMQPSEPKEPAVKNMP